MSMVQYEQEKRKGSGSVAIKQGGGRALARSAFLKERRERGTIGGEG